MFYIKKPDPTAAPFFESAIKKFKEHFDSVHAGDNIILFDRSLGFLRDDKFTGAFRKNARTEQEKSLVFRLHTLVWAARQALHVAGDFVECGVFRGFCMSVIATYLEFGSLPRTMYLYDTFAGIPPEFDTEKFDAPIFHKPGIYESVIEKFAPYPNIRVVRGIVPTSFAEAAPERIAFLHLDMNSSKSEIAALDVLFERVTPGGVIVFDDYGWLSYRAQQRAEDAFMAARGHHILELPTGQGLLIKH